MPLTLSAAEKLSADLTSFVRSLYDTEEFIPLHIPLLGVKEAKAVAGAIESGMISTVGPQVGEFEEKLKELTGAGYVVASVNGTAALHLALITADVKPGDEVITQALTFVATANAISYCGAEPVFLDVDRGTMSLCPDAVAAFLDENAERSDNGAVINKRSGRRIAACLPMHTNGHPGDMLRLAEVCAKWDLPLIEDAAEALGSFRDGKHAGRVGRVATLSFNGNKIISTGQGGAVITDDAELAGRIRHIAAVAKEQHPWRFQHDQIGYNYRLPALNAALGIAQLERLPAFLESKRILAQEYTKWFEAQGLEPVREPEGAKSNFWFNAFFTEGAKMRDAVLEATNKAGVMTRPFWDPMNTLRQYQHCHCDELTNTKWLFDRLINVPSTPRVPK